MQGGQGGGEQVVGKPGREVGGGGGPGVDGRQAPHTVGAEGRPQQPVALQVQLLLQPTGRAVITHKDET